VQVHSKSLRGSGVLPIPEPEEISRSGGCFAGIHPPFREISSVSRGAGAGAEPKNAAIGFVPFKCQSPTIRALYTRGLWDATVLALRQCRSSPFDSVSADELSASNSKVDAASAASVTVNCAS